MKRVVHWVSLCSLLVAPFLMADLTPGPTIGARGLIVDFNGDGLDDLVGNRIFLNNGTTFVDVGELGLPAGEVVRAFLDVNGDRRIDVLTQEQKHRDEGRGAFRIYAADAAMQYAVYATLVSGFPTIANLDGDGMDDLVLVHSIVDSRNVEVGSRLELLRSRGDRGFDSRGEVRLPTFVISERAHLQSVDVNKDGHTDLVLRLENDLAVVPGTGGGAFGAPIVRFLPALYGTRSLNVADIDGDGNQDIVLAGQRTIRVLLGDGRGNFPRTTTAPLTTPSEWNFAEPRDLAVGRFGGASGNQIAAGTNDGDIVVFGWQSGQLVEISRTSTRLRSLSLAVGAFRSTSKSDLMASSHETAGAGAPSPRLYFGNPNVASNRVTSYPRRRSAALGSSTTETVLDVVQTSDCHMRSDTDTWRLQRIGFYGVETRGDLTIEVLFEPEGLTLRITSSANDSRGLWGISTLRQMEPGRYRGYVATSSPCGVSIVALDAHLRGTTQ